MVATPYDIVRADFSQFCDYVSVNSRTLFVFSVGISCVWVNIFSPRPWLSLLRSSSSPFLSFQALRTQRQIAPHGPYVYGTRLAYARTTRVVKIGM